MAIGMKNTAGDAPFLDTTTHPWTTMAKKDLKMSLKDLQDEIKRREPGEKSPRCSNWKVAICTAYLLEHLVTNSDNVDFIERKIGEFLESIEAVLLEPAAAAWHGNVPYLRLILCLVQDDIKEKFIHRGDPTSRTEFHAHNSIEVRAPTVYEMMSDLWNDLTVYPFVPVSSVIASTTIQILLGTSALPIPKASMMSYTEQQNEESIPNKQMVR
jgi:hypothetical protein